MRWPLRNQIFVRMLVLLMITIGALTYTSIYSIIAANEAAENDRVDRLVELMSTSRFPLTSPVLENMKLLSGAEFMFVEGENGVVSKTAGAPLTILELGLSNSEVARQSLETRAVPGTIAVSGKYYLHTAVSGIRDREQATNQGVLHILVPRKSEPSVWWQASKSPLTVALFVLPLALLFSLALASQVTLPLTRLNDQVHRIADGKTQTIPEVRRNDEIYDLNVSINEMAVKLQDHEAQLRKNERLKTMVQFGNGVAHHLRNSATGCKMAVELLAAEQQGIANSENYQVANRQLGLMDNYIKKFLLLSKSPESNRPDEVDELDFGDVLENVVFLLRPSAEHLGVGLSIKSNCDGSKFRMSEEDGQQLMMNLISNAIRAASEIDSATTPNEQGLVTVQLSVQDSFVMFSVTDNGSGPPEKIADSIFDPFVTGAKEGTGLGLSLVREITNRANGKIDWSRENHRTTFCFEAGNQQVSEAG